MRVLVCGGRDYNDQERVNRALDSVNKKHRVVLVIHGAARGADMCAEQWAKSREVPYVGVPAEWSARGRSAGYHRNKAMLVWNPDAVVAFPGGRGTEMMIEIAEREGIPVWKV